MSEFTVQEILTRMNELPRAVPALEEVLAICADNLPVILPEVGLPPPRSYGYVETEIDNAKFPALVVGASIRTDPAGHSYMDSSQVAVIYAFAGPRIAPEDFRRSLDVAQVVRALLSLPTVVGPRYADDGTTIIWNTLLPAQQCFSPVPPNYPYFQGWQAAFMVDQYPVAGTLWPTQS